jgi:tetratricopeptide (TPR) repeat protein
MSKTNLIKEFLKFEKSLDKLRKENKFTEIIEKYAEREEQFKEHPTFWVNYGIMIFTSLELNKAIKAMEKALVIDPEDTNAIMNIAVVYSYMKKMEKTRSLLEKVIEIDPKHELAWFTLSEFWRNKKRVEKQIDCLEKLLELYPENEDYWEKLIGIYKSKNDVDKIIECYLKLKDLHSEDANYWWILGHHYLMTKKDWDNAILILKKAVEMDDSKFESLRDLGYAYIAKEDRPSAIIYLEKALETNPKDKYSWEVLIAAYRGSNNPEKAEETKERAENCLFNDILPEKSYRLPESIQKALEDFVKEAIVTNETMDTKKKIENMFIQNVRPTFIPALLELSDEEITEMVGEYQGKLSNKYNEFLSNLEVVYKNFNSKKDSKKSIKVIQLEQECWQNLHSCFLLEKKEKRVKLESVIDSFVKCLVINPKSIASLVGLGIALMSGLINRDDASEFFAKASSINNELTNRILTEQQQLENVQKLHRAVLDVV